MAGERQTRPHRGSQQRLSPFNVVPPLRITALDKLELEPLEGVPRMDEVNTVGGILDWARKLDAALRDKGYVS